MASAAGESDVSEQWSQSVSCPVGHVSMHPPSLSFSCFKTTPPPFQNHAPASSAVISSAEKCPWWHWGMTQALSSFLCFTNPPTNTIISLFWLAFPFFFCSGAPPFSICSACLPLLPCSRCLPLPSFLLSHSLSLCSGTAVLIVIAHTHTHANTHTHRTVAERQGLQQHAPTAVELFGTRGRGTEERK